MSRIRYTNWSTSGLLATVQRDALLPNNQNTYSSADMLTFLDQSASNIVVPFLTGLDQNYFLKTSLVTVQASQSRALSTGAASQFGSNPAYALPTDAVGKKLFDVAVIGTGGGICVLPQVTPFQAGTAGPLGAGFWVEGDQLFLFPANRFTTAQVIQIIYPAVPLKLCDDTGAPTTAEGVYDAGLPTSAQITAVDTTTGEVTLAVLPASWVMDTEVNFVKGTPQFATTGTGSPALVSGSGGPLSIFVDPATLFDPAGNVAVAAGDWVADAGYAPFLQMPQEAVNMVTQAAVVRLLQGLADDAGAQRAQGMYDRMEAASRQIFSPRVNDAPKVLSTYGRGVGAWRLYGPWVR